MNVSIDLNCDMGEGIGNEELIMPFISSCNVACGGHYGNYESVSETVCLAKKNAVKIGAHPSYPDTENFGRRSLDISHSELQISISDQVSLIQNILKDVNGSLHHIKPHGALYSDINKNDELCKSFLEALIPFKTNSILYLLAGSGSLTKAKALGFKTWGEAFVDRAYQSDGSLVPRSHHLGILGSPKKIQSQALKIAIEQKVNTINGVEIDLKARTLCIHGDNPNSANVAKNLQKTLSDHAIQLK